MRYVIGAIVGLCGLGFAGAPAQARPCEAHAGAKRSACLTQWKRDRMDWPPNPAKWEIVRRVGRSNYAKAIRVAYCETGANPRHFPHGRYIGMLGMYRSTYAYGARRTGYPHPGRATEQQQVAIAVAAHPITRGWSGWGCGGV
jgi:hypothetical protein